LFFVTFPCLFSFLLPVSLLSFFLFSELVLTQGHDKSADYWAFGILLYEILCGHTPFESSNQQRTFEKIVHSQKHLIFPPEFDPHAKSLIRRLLHPNAALRIGALQNGINDITNHAFFAMRNLDFELVISEQVEMIYKPTILNDVTLMNLKGNTSITVPSLTTANVEPLDIEYEKDIDPDDPYDKYFQIEN
jgi:serine/threonine protein kinase